MTHPPHAEQPRTASTFCAWCGLVSEGEEMTPALIDGHPAIVCRPCAEGLTAPHR